MTLHTRDVPNPLQATEAQEQETLIAWIRVQRPWLLDYTIYIMNERKTSVHYGSRLNRMGRLKGASDLFILWPTSKYFGLFIEMKSRKGKPTKAQIDFIERVNKIGYYGRVCYGAEEAIALVTLYLLNEL